MIVVSFGPHIIDCLWLAATSLHASLIHNRIDMVHDVFGREKHKLHSDNMGGVGSFEKDCRTLYVGRLGKHKELENILWKEFGEWGEIEVLHGPNNLTS